jgi:hypothetical protein
LSLVFWWKHWSGLMGRNVLGLAPFAERERSGADLTIQQLAQWDQTVTRHRAEGGRPNREIGLGDFGADTGTSKPPPLPIVVADGPQAFVKFLGEGDNRVPLSFPTIEEVERAVCHWQLRIRPRSGRDRLKTMR